MNPGKAVQINIDRETAFQTIDGFGVNINSKYWNNGALIPAMELLVDDLGATIYRLDAYGKSNWVDPNNQYDSSILNQTTYDRVYAGIDFQNAALMCRYLNEKGIEPFITLSGIVPKWMCADDGKTLKDYTSFAEMAISYLRWLKEKAHVKYSLVSPLNETDIGPPEGPFVSPEEFPKVLSALEDALERSGLKEIRFTLADQALPDLSYVKAFHYMDGRLAKRIARIGIHAYGRPTDIPSFVDNIKNSSFSSAHLWMTEYGDLDQSGENEWYFSRVIFKRLLWMLDGGVNAALNWDAFDNYHDHDESWTIYGIIRAGLRRFTPKKRFYACKQIYRLIRPGAVRIKAESSSKEVTALAFMDKQAGKVIISGINDSAEDILIQTIISGFDKSWKSLKKGNAYLTTPDLNCAEVPCNNYIPWVGNSKGNEVAVPAGAIFTIATEL
jgi:O-glycosyl hydrolase